MELRYDARCEGAGLENFDLGIDRRRIGGNVGGDLCQTADIAVLAVDHNVGTGRIKRCLLKRIEHHADENQRSGDKENREPAPRRGKEARKIQRASTPSKSAWRCCEITGRHIHKLTPDATSPAFIISIALWRRAARD